MSAPQSCVGQPGGKDRLRGERWHLVWAWRGLVVPSLCARGGSRALAASHTGRAGLSACLSVTRSGSEFSAGNVTDQSSLALV